MSVFKEIKDKKGKVIGLKEIDMWKLSARKKSKKKFRPLKSPKLKK